MKRITLLFLIPVAMGLLCMAKPGKSGKPAATKELYLPVKIGEVPKGNDFNDPASRFCYSRSAQTNNVAVFWDVAFGPGDPMNFADTLKRFDLNGMLAECDRFYKYYTDELRFLDRGRSLADKYKMITLVICDDDNTVYGGGEADTVGMTWMRPVRMKSHPYCALAHELSHSFQYIARADGSEIRGRVAYGEMTSQWMLSHVYPDWMTIENYHWRDLMKKTHYGLFHETNMYHSPYILEYWGYRHGDPIVGRIWRETRRDEDMIMAYKRITGITQEQFNAEAYDQAARLITYDIPRIEKVARRYANQHSCKLESVSGGWYRIARDRCPQNYGYNGIRLNAPADGTEITLQFKGLAGQEGYNAVKTDKAGWRYGFLAVDTDGKRTYGEMGSDPDGSLKFTTPKDTQYLWLVVMGAPTEHWERPRPKSGEADEEWPYQIKLDGTVPHAYVMN